MIRRMAERLAADPDVETTGLEAALDFLEQQYEADLSLGLPANLTAFRNARIMAIALQLRQAMSVQP